MFNDKELLFAEQELSDVLRSIDRQIVEKINTIPEEQFIISSEEDILQNVLPQFYFEPLRLYRDNQIMEHKETQVDVSGDRSRHVTNRQVPCYVPGIDVKIYIPYSGDRALWKLRPSTYRSVFPRAIIQSQNRDGIGNVLIRILQPSDGNFESMKKHIEDTINDIEWYIKQQREEIEKIIPSFQQTAKMSISARRERLKKHEEIAKMINIPIKKRDDVPDIQPINLKRQLIRPLPSFTKEGLKPEPGISDEDYEHILGVIRHVARTFEASPKTFAKHDEEELRDFILANLNGHYEGGASGETFRRKGKTDVRIEDSDRAAFVAECKVWGGSAELTKACDQLLGYLTWRDCKAAIVVFNKHNAKFSELLNKVPETVSGHPLCKRTMGQQKPGEWRYIFQSAEDEGRSITVHLFLINIYV